MIFNEKIVKAKFIDRPNRFKANVILDGVEVVVHVPNTGRCKEILIPDCDILLRKAENPNRKTQYDLIAGYKDGKLINIDSQVPNKVVEEALQTGMIDKLKNFNCIEREKVYGNSRFDFKLSNYAGEIYYLEVKGVTLEERGYSMFPDAPTDRGRKHVLELIDAKKNNIGAGILFLIQMDEMKGFSTNKKMDPKFAEAVTLAYKSGVDIFAYDCTIGENFLTLSNEVPVCF